MAEQTEVPLSFGGGEHHVAHETRIPEGYARRVVNWDLDDTGVAHQRHVLGLLSGGAECHSGWEDPATGVVYLVAESKLCTYQGGSIVPVPGYLGGHVTLNNVARVYYERVGDIVYFTNGIRHGVVRKDGMAYPWGVPNPVSPVRDVNAGIVRYLTYESPEGQESGAVRFDTGAPPARVGLVPRLYWSDGESTSYRLNGTGRELRTQSLVQFPPGRLLAHTDGRMVVARGGKLYYSQPLNYGLIDPRYDFFDAGGRVSAIAPVRGGTFVSTRGSTVFLQGDPENWSRAEAVGAGVLPGGVCRVPVAAVPDGVAAQDGDKYAWAALTEDGLMFLLDGGRTIQPAKGRVRFPYVEVKVDLVMRDGYYQVVAVPVEAPPAFLEAIDSPLQITEV